MHAPDPARRSLLRRFTAKANAVQKQPWIDQRAHTVYALVVGVAVLEVSMLLLGRFTFDNTIFLRLFMTFVTLLLCGLAARRYGMPRVATGLEMLALPGLVGALIGTGAFMVTALARPMADDLLSRADVFLGFDWVGLFRFYQRHPNILPFARLAYFSMLALLAIIPLALVITGREARAWVFITAYAFAGVATVAIHPFFPAAGPYVHFGIAPADLPSLGLRFPWVVGETIDAIRSGKVREISTSLSGLVSFPSFHAASGFLLAWAIAPVPRLRVLLILLIAAMIAATPTIGSHYFIDLVAGAIVALLAIFLGTVATRRGRS